MKRRTILKGIAAASLGLNYIPGFISKGSPNARIRVAHVGINGMGMSHLRWFNNLKNVEIGGLCDVDALHLAKAKKVQEELQTYAKPILTDDFRRLLDSKDIDVISCATPDHWHAQVAILAFQAGKDVYGEKPLSFDVVEGQKMLQAKEKYGRVFQLGTQIHAGDNYHRVVELVQSGYLGKIEKVRLWKTGEPPVINAFSQVPIPSHLNYDFWQGTVPERTYAPERVHFNYRYFMDYSGGVFQDFWCHAADLVWWALEPKKLKSISARGEKSDGLGDTPKWIEVDYAFKDLEIHWTSSPPDFPDAKDMGLGILFEGSEGKLLANYSTRKVYLNNEVLGDIPEVPKSILRSPGHQQNFIDNVLSRGEPQSNLAYARRMTMPMHLGLISWQLGRTLKWNAKKERFKGDAEANALLSREKRSKYNWI